MSSQLPTALAVTFALIISPNVSAARAQEKSLTCRTRFNGDALKGAIKALHAAGKTYDEHVTEPDIHISGNTAWIAYVNKGSITDASRAP